MFLSDLIKNRSVIYELTRRDIKQQYAGSYLGFVWAFLQPVLFIAVLYMIFALGFRTGATNGIPYSIYLISGMIAWLYIADNLTNCSTVIKSHSFLVKKINFRLSILPIVKLLGSLLSHFFLIALAILFAWIKGNEPSPYTFQIIYYLFAMQLLLLGFGWITSSAYLFVSDVYKIIAILVQFGFWLTPIFWNLSIVPQKYHWIMMLNPACYIVTGYRDSIIGKVGFWERPYETLVFWCITITFLIIGISIYRRLKPHFAEVV